MESLKVDLELARAHYSRSGEIFSLYDKFFALWAAYNVMYEGIRHEVPKPTERLVAKHCAKKLEYEVWSRMFKDDRITSLLSITPIFNEAHYRREANMVTWEFENLTKWLRKAKTSPVALDDRVLESLVDVLYLVRCNLVHGFKAPGALRDEEVLSATVPLLECLVSSLIVYFEG